jgi:alpha-ketoglutarate-dependent 2,4-dichlorophenoxyacetate dioxygenase
MAITIYPVTPSFAAEVGDIDLSRQIEPADLAAVYEAFAEYAVLIFPDQHLSQDQHLDFAKHFGPLETTIALYRRGEPLRLRQEFADVSNLNYENDVWGKESRQRLFQLGNRLWHTDSSFKRLPSRASLLYARSIRFMPVRFHRSAAIRNLPTSGRPTTLCRRKPSAASIHSWLSIRSSTRALASASPISTMRNDRECRRYRRWSCARSPSPGANRSTWRPMRAASSACPRTTVAR